MLIYNFAIREMRFFLVPSSSMEPTLVPPEYFMTLNQKEYRRGDIVVVDDPLEGGAYLVKRLVGIGGDRISVRDGDLYINGGYVSEPYRVVSMEYGIQEYSVGAEEIFLLGDNRNKSVDSHNWNEDPGGRTMIEGVPLDSIVGKVRFVYLPFSRMRRVLSYPLMSLTDP